MWLLLLCSLTCFVFIEVQILFRVLWYIWESSHFFYLLYSIIFHLWNDLVGGRRCRLSISLVKHKNVIWTCTFFFFFFNTSAISHWGKVTPKRKTHTIIHTKSLFFAEAPKYDSLDDTPNSQYPKPLL